MLLSQQRHSATGKSSLNLDGSGYVFKDNWSVDSNKNIGRNRVSSEFLDDQSEFSNVGEHSQSWS